MKAVVGWWPGEGWPTIKYPEILPFVGDGMLFQEGDAG